MLYDVPMASLVGLTGFYIIAIQAITLYLPRGASNWRIAFAVRALVYISDPSKPPISVARGLESTFPGFCVVSTPPPDTPRRTPALSDCSKEETVSAPARGRKRKSLSAPQSSTAKASKKQRETPVDWVELGAHPRSRLIGLVWPIKDNSSKKPKTAPKKQRETQPKKVAATSSRKSREAKLNTETTNSASPADGSSEDEESDAEEESIVTDAASLESDN